MAFSEVSTPSNQEAVCSAISTFAQANGWTEEHFVTAGSSVNGRGVLTLSRGSTVVTFRWSGTDADNIAMYHALAYPGGMSSTQKEQPWAFATDSGNGTTSATSLSSQRRVSGIANGPYVRLTMFSGASDGYVWCVLEYSSGKFRHFGFWDGLEEKIGNWTGGGGVAGHVWATGSGVASNPQNANHSVLLDGSATGTETERATLHCAGLEGQGGSEVFGVSMNSTSDPGTNDRAGNLRHGVHGGVRRGFFDSAFLQFVPEPLSGVIELTPAMLFFKERGAANYQALGFLPGVRTAQIRNLAAGEELTAGSDTWKFFPVTSKSDIGGTNEESDNMGLAYKKVV